jgi:hypothetical protein
MALGKAPLVGACVFDEENGESVVREENESGTGIGGALHLKVDGDLILNGVRDIGNTFGG